MDASTSPWRGRPVLVTGCTGFLGGAVVRELLAGGAAVVGLVRDRVADDAFTRHMLAGKVHVVRGRAEDSFRLHSAMAVHEVAAVLHLTDAGTPTVLDAVRRYDPRVPLVLAEPTGTSRLTPAVRPNLVGVARFGALFGPGDRHPDRLVPAAVLARLQGRPLPLPADGQVRDWVHVRDAARACVRLAEALLTAPGPADMTFASGWALTDRGMAAAVTAAVDGRPVLAPTGTADQPLGWSPATAFADALAETVGWYRRSAGTTPPAAPRRAAA